MKRFAPILAACTLTACTTLVPPPIVDLEGVDPDEAWERVLAEYVDEAGRIDFDSLPVGSLDLNRWVAWLALEKNQDLSGDAKLAYMINGYNGLAMYNAIHASAKPSSMADFFYFHRLVFEGKEISLYTLENEYIRTLGDPRVHFALNCMVRSCPRLPQEPFRAEELDAQLEAAAREFLGDPRHVRLDAAEETVWFSAILDWYEEDFLAEAPSLIDYVNRYRDEPIPAGWDHEFSEYDWSLNAQTP